jgi:hypothetical protein
MTGFTRLRWSSGEVCSGASVPVAAAQAERTLSDQSSDLRRYVRQRGRGAQSGLCSGEPCSFRGPAQNGQLSEKSTNLRRSATCRGYSPAMEYRLASRDRDMDGRYQAIVLKNPTVGSTDVALSPSDDGDRQRARNELGELAQVLDEPNVTAGTQGYQAGLAGINEGPTQSTGSISKRTCTMGAFVLLKTV